LGSFLHFTDITSKLEESELIRKCQHGESKAQEALYARYADSMLRLSLRYIKTIADAEDVMITAFTRVFSHIRTFDHRTGGSLEGWIRKIVVNESLMWLRRRHNFNLTESIDIGLPEPDLSQLALLEAADILKLIEELPTGYRTIFNLSVVEGYSHQEIAALLEISEGTSRSQLFKAKVILRKMLTQEGYQYGT
jgi:RNA polymerase sigma factor (sigma-70 family)